MSSLLLGVGRGFRFGNMEPSWFYRLDALTITQPQCGTKSIPINPQYITPDIPDKIKTAAQKKNNWRMLLYCPRVKNEDSSVH